MGGRHAPPIRESRRQGKAAGRAKGVRGLPAHRQHPDKDSCNLLGFAHEERASQGPSQVLEKCRQITRLPRRGRRALPAHTVELFPMREAWPNSSVKTATTAGVLENKTLSQYGRMRSFWDSVWDIFFAKLGHFFLDTRKDSGHFFLIKKSPDALRTVAGRK